MRMSKLVFLWFVTYTCLWFCGVYIYCYTLYGATLIPLPGDIPELQNLDPWCRYGDVLVISNFLDTDAYGVCYNVHIHIWSPSAYLKNTPCMRPNWPRDPHSEVHSLLFLLTIWWWVFSAFQAKHSTQSARHTTRMDGLLHVLQQ